MFDEIKIVDLEVFANHGVFKEETKLGQKFLFTVTLLTDTSFAGKSDKLEDSVNYGQVAEFVTQYTKEHTVKLIETAAKDLAEALLIEFELVKGVEIEVKKPWAPIGLPLSYASVKIKRLRHTAYIALGSNIGDTKGYLDFAVKSISEIKGCIVRCVSSYITTKPYGGVEQDNFLNGAMSIETILSPQELLSELQRIELEAHRERKVHWGPRTLDLDIIMYDDYIVEENNLKIPHIEMHKRDFVLKPLAEIAPYLRHPVFNKTVIELMENL